MNLSHRTQAWFSFPPENKVLWENTSNLKYPLMGKVGELTGIPTDDIEVEQSREDYGPMVLSLVALPAMLLAASGMLYLILSLLGSFGS